MIFIGITIAFFLEFLLLIKAKKSNADSVLAIWLLIIGLHLLLFYLRHEEKFELLPLFIGLDIPLPLLHGPLLYLYTATLTNQLPRKNLVLSLHFIPFLISLAFVVPFLLLPIEFKVQTFQNDGQGYEVHNFVNQMAVLVSGFAYFISSLILLKRHSVKIKNYFSDTDKINLHWLRYLIYGIGSIWIVVVFLDDIFIFSSVVVFVLLIGIIGIRQTEIFTPNKEKPDPDSVLEDEIDLPGPDKNAGRYSNSGLTEELSDRIYQNLVQLMDEKAVFKENDLSLVSLAKMLNTRPNYLSQVINEKTGNNFYSYINNRRIEEIKKQLALPENNNEKIFLIAYDCGFNSKSSFHKYFKQSTGLTPTEYLEQL